ncbi:hypothetical protein HWV62_23777 [Athelia sp. TMB]|nr:hypothetical protein HWV62_23777 [Athelia sp. TMB]
MVKQDLIDRLIQSMDNWKLRGDVEKWNKAKGVIQQVQASGVYTSGNMPRVSYPIPGTSQIPPVNGANVKPYAQANATAGSSTNIVRYDPYAPPRRPTAAAATAPATTSGPPKSSSATDRRQQTVTFTLNAEHIAKLTAPGSKYQLRLFCTSSIFHTAGANSFRTTSPPCPIEFPPTCEIRVNNVQITANTKGLKKKPGTAPPADLGKAIRMTAQSQNRVELIYVNSQQPVQPKKFYMVVSLVEVTGVDELVQKVKKGKYKSTADVLAKMVASISDDDDIVAGPQKMSLKCPYTDAYKVADTIMQLSYMRITTPCRSSLYFDDILKQTSEGVEDVIVEADGEWHTSDNKYGSSKWRSTHAPILPKAPSLPPPPKPESLNQNGKKKAIEIMVLDSDDEDDEGRVKRELSPSFASGSSSTANHVPPPSQSPGDVIDLTLDSDDECPPLPSKTAEKRKAPDYGVASPTELHSKRSRVDIPLQIPRANGHVNGTSANGHINGTTISPSALSMQHHYDPVTTTIITYLVCHPSPDRMPSRPLSATRAIPHTVRLMDRTRLLLFHVNQATAVGVPPHEDMTITRLLAIIIQTGGREEDRIYMF